MGSWEKFICKNKYSLQLYRPNSIQIVRAGEWNKDTKDLLNPETI